MTNTNKNNLTKMSRKEIIIFLKDIQAGRRKIDELVARKETKIKTITLIEHPERRGYFAGKRERTDDYLTPAEREEHCNWIVRIFEIKGPAHPRPHSQ